jgi:hypothetical protein
MMTGKTETETSQIHHDNHDASGAGFFRKSDMDDGTNLGYCFDLSCEQRMRGFRIFFVFVVILLLIDSILIFTADMWDFFGTYILALLCMIFATFFLFGPVRQFKNIIGDSQTMAVTIVYIMMTLLITIITLTATFYQGCVIFILFQFIAYVHYIIRSIRESEQSIIDCTEICSSHSRSTIARVSRV